MSFGPRGIFDTLAIIQHLSEVSSNLTRILKLKNDSQDFEYAHAHVPK